MLGKLLGTVPIMVGLVASQASAQQPALGEQERELYAEMLAMGLACTELIDFRVRQEEMQDWVAERLASVSDEDLDSVLNLRDSKIVEMQNDVAAMNAMPTGNAKAAAANAHYARANDRCNRMARHSVAGQFFIRR